MLVVLILSVLVLRGRRKSGIEQKNGLSDSQFSQFLLNSAEETSMEEAERDASLFFAKGDEKASR